MLLPTPQQQRNVSPESWTFVLSRILIMAKPILILVKLNVKSMVCVNLVVCLCVHQKKQAESRFITHSFTHSRLPPGFHWYSARARMSSDWFLQTDAEGDTHSLINWPSRYTQAGRVPPQNHLPCLHSAGFSKIHQALWAVLLKLQIRTGPNSVPHNTTILTLFLTILSFRVKIHLLSWGPELIKRHACLRTSAFELLTVSWHHPHPHCHKLHFPWLQTITSFPMHKLLCSV